MGEPLRGKLTVLNPWPPIRRLWLRASEVRRRLSVAFPAEIDRLRRQQQQPPSQPSDSQEPSNSSGSSSAVSEHPQQQPPPQPPIAQEPSTPRESLLSLSSDETDAQSFVTAQLEVPLEALASPIALQRVSPNRGPISGGGEILLVGYGFSEDQDLGVRFGESAAPVQTKWINPFILHCILPSCDSARCVVVTLHSPGRPDQIQNEGEIFFTYEGVIELFQALLLGVLNHQPPKGPPVDYNQSGNPLSPSSPNPPSASMRQSQHSPPMQMIGTDRSQSQTLSTDSNQIITEDDIIHLFSSVPLEQYCNSINLVNRHGQNLAHLCTRVGYHRLLVTVVERGADIHAKDANGWTPLDFARLHHDEDAIDILEGDWEENIENIISKGSSSIDLLRRFISGGPPLNALTHDDKLREDTRETAAKLVGSMSADTPSVLSGNRVRKEMFDSVQDSQHKQSPDASTIMRQPEEMPSPSRDERKCTSSETSTPVLNAPASSSLAPFVATFDVPPMQKREINVLIPASSASIASNWKEGSIDALRARYSTIHSSTILSQHTRNREQEGETDNDEEDTFMFVESFEEGKEKAKPMPDTGLVPSPIIAAAIVPPVEEKKEKEKEQEKGEQTQEQTQEMTAVETKEIRANTPSISMADVPSTPPQTTFPTVRDASISKRVPSDQSFLAEGSSTATATPRRWWILSNVSVPGRVRLSSLLYPRSSSTHSDKRPQSAVAGPTYHVDLLSSGGIILENGWTLSEQGGLPYYHVPDGKKKRRSPTPPTELEVVDETSIAMGGGEVVDLWDGVEFGYRAPSWDVTPSLLRVKCPPSDIPLTLYPSPSTPFFIRAPSWRVLLRLLASLTETIILPTPEALAEVKRGEANLRLVVQFVWSPFVPSVGKAKVEHRDVALYLCLHQEVPYVGSRLGNSLRMDDRNKWSSWDTSVLPYGFKAAAGSRLEKYNRPAPVLWGSNMAADAGTPIREQDPNGDDTLFITLPPPFLELPAPLSSLALYLQDSLVLSRNGGKYRATTDPKGLFEDPRRTRHVLKGAHKSATNLTVPLPSRHHSIYSATSTSRPSTSHSRMVSPSGTHLSPHHAPMFEAEVARGSGSVSFEQRGPHFPAPVTTPQESSPPSPVRPNPSPSPPLHINAAQIPGVKRLATAIKSFYPDEDTLGSSHPPTAEGSSNPKPKGISRRGKTNPVDHGKPLAVPEILMRNCT